MNRKTNLSSPLASITVGVILVFSLSTTSFAHGGHSVQATCGNTHTSTMKDGMQMHHESTIPVNWKYEVGFGESDPASLTDHKVIPALQTVTQMASVGVGFAETDPAVYGVPDHETLSGQVDDSRHLTAISQSRHDNPMKEPGKSKMSAKCKC